MNQYLAKNIEKTAYLCDFPLDYHAKAWYNIIKGKEVNTVDEFKEFLEITKDLLEILVLILTAAQLKKKKKRKKK